MICLTVDIFKYPEMGLPTMPDDGISGSAIYLALALLFMAGILVGAEGSDPTGGAVAASVGFSAAPGDNTVRVMIAPKSPRANTLARQVRGVEVRHEFYGYFSADAPLSSIPALQAVADVKEATRMDLHAPGFDGAAVFGDVCGKVVCDEEGIRSCPNDCAAFIVRACVPSVQRDYNVVDVGAGQLRDGAGVNVAVIDTGAASNHLDLKSRIRMCVDTTGAGISNGCYDTDGHGTHTSSIIAADAGSDGEGMYGAAPSANLLVIKACSGDGCLEDDVVEAVDYAAARGADIVLLPFGSSSEVPFLEGAILRYPDILFVSSAGNKGPDPRALQYPAAYPGVVAVGAVDGNRQEAWFSSRGKDDSDNLLVSKDEVELAAGGVNVESANTDGCYVRVSGTSFAAATIAGLAAKVWDSADGGIDGLGDAVSTRRYLIRNAFSVVNEGGASPFEEYSTRSGYGVVSGS